MIRLGSKEKRCYSSPPLTRSQTYPLERIPLEMKEEILMKLKGKCISKFISISKSWSSIVRSKRFTNLYLNRSLAQPRILLSLTHRGDNEMQLFYSCSQEDPSSDHQTVSCPPLNHDNLFEFFPPVRGLLCCLNDNNRVMIGNPTTCQFITLPRVQTVRKGISYFFGYDPVNGEYKVLCMTASRNGTASDVVSQEHQVFTLGARSKKWRKIECKHPHYTSPRTEGLCSNGFVYYLAWIQLDLSLICFDVRSEKFSLIELPKGGNVQYLSHYGEKIVAANLLVTGTLDLWVLEDASKPHWSEISIVIPSWTDSYGQFEFFILRGRLGNGELVLAPVFVTDPFFILCYDLKESKARKIQMEGIGTHLMRINVYLDHVESPMVLEL
ncbi:PREDICTED: putative F-box protein At3g10790 [Camelina sativa]|uniref:F-box protein At3g10790 n=1 Tax=Camelina sativa TaxID=90675 RepID=A0ABM0XRC0_CAMSA|nr:PREDICTED: putative F-box protein At3g10790 [Camelina sativa]